jgi:hypothetical protein
MNAPKETPLHKRLARLGEYAKAMETRADNALWNARVALYSVNLGGDVTVEQPTPLKRAASQAWGHIYARRAKIARRDEKRLARVVAWCDEREQRVAAMREKATA